MSKISASSAVSGSSSDGWDVECPVTDGTCGADGKPFTSTGWPTKASAVARAEEHFAEHRGETVMSTLEDFRAEHGLDVDKGGKAVVSAKDL